MKLRSFLLCTIILGVLTLIVVPIVSATNEVTTEQVMYLNDQVTMDSISYLNKMYEDQINKKKDSLKKELVNEVYAYIGKQSPTMAPVVTNNMVDISLRKDFDLCFMMAQAQLETNFGKTGSGKSRKSIFGVNGRFGSYRECIEKYVNLVQTKYLGPNKTEQHLLRNYVTLRGNYRYAGYKNYEPELKNVYNHIRSKTDIERLQNEFSCL